MYRFKATQHRAISTIGIHGEPRLFHLNAVALVAMRREFYLDAGQAGDHRAGPKAVAIAHRSLLTACGKNQGDKGELPHACGFSAGTTDQALSKIHRTARHLPAELRAIRQSLLVL